MSTRIASIALAIILILIPSLPALAQESDSETITITMTTKTVIEIELSPTDWDIGIIRPEEIHESANHNLDVDIAKIKLCLRRGEENSFLKVGTSQMERKHSQLMMKLASFDRKVIQGTLKPVIEGKPRGSLEFCNHIKKELFIIANASEFLGALECFSL